MEWREQSSVSCDDAYLEAQRWIEAVTKKKFGSNDFRSALENGVLLCDLINKIKPGIIKRVNRLPTPIAGLDNLNVFLKACGKLGLREAQLFHPGDLQDLSTRVTVKHQETNRRLKNVLITIYWLDRRAQCERFYDGPYLNFKAFEGLLGTALYKALQESPGQKSSNVRDSGFGDSWCSELHHLRGGEEGGGGGGSSSRHRRDDSLDSLDSLGSRPHSISSEATLKGSSEGCCSDAEADSVFRMAENKDTLGYRRSAVIAPKPSTQFNQFLPSKDKQSGYVPAPLRKKRYERNEDSRRSWANVGNTGDEGMLTSEARISSDCHGNDRVSPSSLSAPQLQWAYGYESGSDSDADRPDPDLVLDDLASRRFHSPSPAPPTNFAVPISPLAGGRLPGSKEDLWPKVTVTPSVAPQQNVTCHSKSGKTQPPKHGSVKVDHRRAVQTNSLFRDMYDDSEDEDDDVGYADPVQDDLYARKMGIKPQPARGLSYDKFLPKFWTPEEDVHIQKINLGSQRRPWYKKMQGFSGQKSGSSSDDSECDISPWLSSAPSRSGPPPSHSHTHEASAQTTVVVGKRQRPTQESIDGSKSTSDIQLDPTVVRQARYEELQKFRETVKESDDKWQDDLSKWKSRRKSVNSEIVKKKEEREKIEQITYGGDKKTKTLKEMQEEREFKRKSSVGSRLGSLSYLDDAEDVFERPVTISRPRTLHSRSYTIDTPYYSESSEPALKTEEPPAVSPPTIRAASPPTSQEVKLLDSRAGRNPSITATTINTPTITPASHSSVNSSLSPAAVPLQRSPAVEHSSATKKEETASVVLSSSSPQKVPEPRRPLLGTQTEAKAPSSDSLSKQQPQLSSMEPEPPGLSQVSASLPRSYQRSDSARLTSVVTPRPFGTQSSRITSLPRVFTMDDSQKRVNGAVDVSKKTSVPSRYHQFMTSEDEAQSSSAHSSEEEEEEEETTAKGVTLSQSISFVKNEVPESPAPTKETSQENFCEMRISLNQKPNSSRDFGFNAAWDSTGARVTSIQPGSPAKMCQLQTGDEVLTMNGHKVAEMSYTEWKSCNEEALQEGSLVMDIRRHGQNNWDRDPPSLPFKSHKTINLTSTDHPIFLGSPETNAAKSSLDFTTRISTETLPTKGAPARPDVDVASNGVNGGFREEPVTMRNKESEPVSLKNLKRRSEFFEQGDSGSSVCAQVYLCGGSESVMPHIPVPAITPSASRWSWDPEEERKRQEKWQKEQERLLQEKYKRDQEKLQEEWLKAQEDIATSVSGQEPGRLELNSHKVGPHSLVSPVHQPTPPLWEEEERKRKAEQERQRQEEQRRMREEEERELQRLQEERKRKAEEERQRQEEQRRMRAEEERELQRLQEERKRKEMQEEEERKMREEEEQRWQMRREEEREEERRQQAAAEQMRRQKALEQQQQWDGGFHGFANVQHPLSFTDRTKSKSSPQLDEEDKPQKRGAHVYSKDEAQWQLEEQLRLARDRKIQRAASELQPKQRNRVSAMRNWEPEIVTGSGFAEKRGQQSSSEAEQERQRILNEMKKKTPLLRDGSWIRQSSTSDAPHMESDAPTMRRGESLDHLETSYNSRRSSWASRGGSFVQNYSRPQSGLPANSSFYIGGSGAQRPISCTLPSSYSMGSLRGGAGTHSSPWSQQSPSPSHLSPSPTTSPEPTFDAGPAQQRSRSVSGKKICTFCDSPLGKGAAMIIESLGLCYHLSCFKCIDCKSDLGGSEAGAEVRIRNKQLYCNSCYMRFKASHPTAM